jgi:hypothetical protein
VKIGNLPTKAIQIDYFNLQTKVTPAAERIFGIYQQTQLQLTAFCSTAQRKTLEFANKSNSN